MVYDLPLVEEKVKPHQVTTLHLICALGFIGAGAIITIYNYTIPMWGGALLIAGILLLLITIFKNAWLIRKANLPMRIVELVIAITVAVYAATQQWKFPTGMFGALSAGLLFALYWEREKGAVLYIHVDDNGLRLPVVRKRSLSWTEIESIVYRFGTLSVNCNDNHLFQWNIADNNVDNEKFEAYCNTKIEEHLDKRIKDDW